MNAESAPRGAVSTVLKDDLAGGFILASDTHGKISITNVLSSDLETAKCDLDKNRVVITNELSCLISSSVSDTELSYLLNSTSNIQDQVNFKASIEYVDSTF